jgi:hypothetical protein
MYINKLFWGLCTALFMVLTAFSSNASFAQSGMVVPVIGINFTATTYKFNGGWPPPDSMGAIGPNHFVEFINGRYAVYDKATGTLVQQRTLDEFWEASVGLHIVLIREGTFFS